MSLMTYGTNDFVWSKQKTPEFFFVCVCMYKMVVEITKETWGKCGIKRIKKYYGKKTKDITEEENGKYKAFFVGKTGIFIIEKCAML